MRVTCLIALAVLCSGHLAAVRSRSVWDGVYLTAQATRGKKVYDETCARCHGETLLGGDDARPLAGDSFVDRWNGKSLWALADLTRRTMPDDGPGVLTRTQTVEVVAYLLSANAFPAGQAGLSTDDDSLKDILIEKKR